MYSRDSSKTTDTFRISVCRISLPKMHDYSQAQKEKKYMLRWQNFRHMDVPVPLIPSRGFDRISYLSVYPENHRTCHLKTKSKHALLENDATDRHKLPAMPILEIAVVLIPRVSDTETTRPRSFPDAQNSAPRAQKRRLILRRKTTELADTAAIEPSSSDDLKRHESSPTKKRQINEQRINRRRQCSSRSDRTKQSRQPGFERKRGERVLQTWRAGGRRPGLEARLRVPRPLRARG
jgi:hypothetical protein